MKNRLITMILVVTILVSGFNFAPSGLQFTGDNPPINDDADPVPEEETENINPLTGLPVENPENLSLPPVLISVTNWPISARPQAGLSFSPIVFELYIGGGESRFLALFYGDYPKEDVTKADGNKVDTGSTESSPPATIGPVRSGRIFYDHLGKLYSGSLVMASAWKGVANNLSGVVNVFGSDEDDVNSAMIQVDQVEDIAKNNPEQLGVDALSGMVFDENAPDGGSLASRFWYIYNASDVVRWDFDEETGSYLRFQDESDGTTFVQATDRLNGDPLTYENIVVLFANHRMCTDYAFDVDLMYIKQAPALVFRDGQVYEVYWTTRNEEYEQTTGKVRPIRFMDANGDPFPMKPGQTWIHLTPTYTSYWETIDSDNIYHVMNNRTGFDGSGVWATRFYSSMMTFDQDVCDMVRE
jgi:hypothetical protein